MKKTNILLSIILVCAIIVTSILACACSNQNTQVTTTQEYTSIQTTQKEIETEQIQTSTQTDADIQTTLIETTETTRVEETTQKEKVDDVVMDDSLIAYYKFDKIESGYVKDESGHGFDAKVYGNPEIVEYDDGRTAIYLKDGGDHLYIEDNKEFNVKPTDSFTLIVKLKWDGKIYDTWPCIVNKGLKTSVSKLKYYGFWLDTQGIPALGCTSVYGNGTSNIFASYKLDTEWHTFMAVQEGDCELIHFFIDGTLIASRPSCDVFRCDVGMYIGINGNTSTEGQFLGQIETIALYKSDLGIKNVKMEGVDGMLKKTYSYTSPKTKETFNLPYRIYYPSDYEESADKEYPVLLFMHGYGEIGTNNYSQLRITSALEENKLLTNTVKRDNCIIVVPQCTDPPKYNWVNLNHVWSTGARVNYSEDPTISLEAVQSLLNEIIETEKVDTKRLYVAGISMGGYATWELLARNPELFAAAIPICGGGILSSAKSLKDTAIWAFHGESDGTVPVSGTRDMIQALQKAGSTKAKATYFPGVGHSCWNNVFAVEGLEDWLFSQSK